MLLRESEYHYTHEHILYKHARKMGRNLEAEEVGNLAIPDLTSINFHDADV